MKKIVYLSFCYLLLMASTCSDSSKPRRVDLPPPPPDRFDGLDVSLSLDGPAVFDYWIHEPFHPQNSQAVTFRAGVRDRFGIKKIELLVLEYALFKNGSGLPSKKRRAGGTWKVVRTWDFGSPVKKKEVSFAFAKGFRAATNVEYIFRVTNANGQRTDRLAIFDAGVSPWPKDKILLYSTTRRPMQQTINLCFFPDTDYGGNFNLFRRDVKKLVYEGYLKSKIIGSHVDRWAFYYTNNEMDGKEALHKSVIGAADFPDFISTNRIEGIDAFGLLHRQEYTDLTYSANNFNFVTNTLFTTESYNLGTAVHETGHAIFRLSDEYDRCACFQSGDWSNVFLSMEDCVSFTNRERLSSSSCRQVISAQGGRWFTPEFYPMFDTEQECRDYNRKHGYNEADCRKWSVEGGFAYEAYEGTCVMRDDGDDEVRQFQDVCSILINKYYDALEAGQAAVFPGSNNTIVLSELVDNMYGYQKVIAVTLKVKGVNQEMQLDKIKMGVPTKTIVRQDDLHLTFTNSGERTLHELKITNPRKILTEGKEESDVIRKNTVSKSHFNIPYNEHYAKGICRTLDDVRMRARSVETIPTPMISTFNLKAQFDKLKSQQH